MRKVLWGLGALIVVVLGVLGAVLAFDAPGKPPALASVAILSKASISAICLRCRLISRETAPNSVIVS